MQAAEKNGCQGYIKENLFLTKGKAVGIMYIVYIHNIQGEVHEHIYKQYVGRADL